MALAGQLRNCRGYGQDDSKVFLDPLMASLSNYQRLERASFDKLRIIRQAQDNWTPMDGVILQLS